MKQQQRLRGPSLAALTLGLALAGCAGGNGPMSSSPGSSTQDASPKPATLSASSVGRSASVPSTLQSPLGESMFMLVSGSGVQIYDCVARPDGTFGWGFRAPEAQLIDATGAVVGKHYAGPTWESVDGSTVVGVVSASAPAPDASAIPWLRLAVKSTTGSGVLTQTKSIQRLQTIGGAAPTSACSSANLGATSRVPYAATYAFFRVGS